MADVRKNFDGNSELEAEVNQVLGSYWNTHVPAPRHGWSTLRADWYNPKTVDMVHAQVKEQTYIAIARLARLKRLEDHLIWMKDEMSNDGVIFFDELFPVEWTELFTDEEWEEMGDCSPIHREVVNAVSQVLPQVVKAAIKTTLKKCMEA